jgi:hypothetical protein
MSSHLPDECSTHISTAVRPGIAGDREALRQLIEDTRRRLVETGTRNRLIHVNRTNTRGNILSIVNGRSDDIYSVLSARRTMRFRALGSDHDEAGETISLLRTNSCHVLRQNPIRS